MNLGTLITGSFIFNAQSRKKDARKLSYVEAELERREAKNTQELSVT